MSVRNAAIWSMASQYAGFAILFTTSVIISRFFLGPAEVGLFSIALSAAMLVSVLQDFGITRYVAGAAELDDYAIRTCFSVSLIFALIVGAAIAALAWPAAQFYGDARLLPLFLVIAGSYLLVPFGIVPNALLQREMDFRSLFYVNVGSILANAVVAIGLAALGFSAMSLAWAAVAQQAVRAIIGQWRSGRHIPLPPSLKGARPILRFGSGMSLLIVSGSIGVRTPELVIGRLLDMVAVGLWSRAAGLSGQLRMLVSGALGSVFYPAFARIRDRGEDMGPPYLRVVAGYSATIWPAMAFLAAAALPIVLLLYGETWRGVAMILVWISLSEIFFTALPLHMDLPILTWRMRKLMALNILDTIVSLGLLLVAATYSLETAAISRIGYGIVWYGIYAAFLHRITGFAWPAMLSTYAKSLAVTLFTVAPLLGLYALGCSPASVGFAELAATALAGGLLWLGGIFALRHPVREDVASVLAGLRAKFV